MKLHMSQPVSPLTSMAECKVRRHTHQWPCAPLDFASLNRRPSPSRCRAGPHLSCFTSGGMLSPPLLSHLCCKHGSRSASLTGPISLALAAGSDHGLSSTMFHGSKVSPWTVVLTGLMGSAPPTPVPGAYGSVTSRSCG